MNPQGLPFVFWGAALVVFFVGHAVHAFYVFDRKGRQVLRAPEKLYVEFRQTFYGAQIPFRAPDATGPQEPR